MSQVFLGGTCGDNNWRDGLIQRMIEQGVNEDALFNPVVPDWTPECQAAEDAAKQSAAFMLFVLADPQQDGNPVSVYSNTEAIMALYDDPARTVVVFDLTGLEGHILKAMTKTAKDLKKRFPEAPIFDSLEEAQNWLLDRLIP